MEINLNEGEHFEPLGCGLEVIVSDVHRITTDTILLADFSKPKPWENACELGSGCGTIPLIWCRENPPRSVCAVELQADGADMINRSVKHNSLEDKIEVINADLRSLDMLIPASFDLVACNPPYKLMGSGILNPSHGRKLARHEGSCTIDDVCRCASRLLRFGGRLCLCQRPERLCDVIASMRSFGIEPKRLRTVQQRPSKPPKLFLIEGKRGARPGGLIIDPTLFIEGDDGGFSSEMLEIYGDYKAGYI